MKWRCPALRRHTSPGGRMGQSPGLRAWDWICGEGDRVPDTRILPLVSFRRPGYFKALGAFTVVCERLSLTEKTEDHTAGTGGQTRVSGPPEEACTFGDGGCSDLHIHRAPPLLGTRRGEDLEAAHLGLVTLTPRPAALSPASRRHSGGSPGGWAILFKPSIYQAPGRSPFTNLAER